MTKKPKHAKPKDHTNAQRQRRYIHRLKEKAANAPPSEAPAPFDGRDLHAIALAMLRIADLLEKLAAVPVIATPDADAEPFELPPAQHYLSGRWKLRDGDNVQPSVDSAGHLRFARRRADRHQGRGKDAR